MLENIITFRMKSESESCSVMSNSSQPCGLYSPWNSPGQNTEVGSLSLHQGVFPIQESNWGLLHCRRILYQLSYERWQMPFGRDLAFTLLMCADCLLSRKAAWVHVCVHQWGDSSVCSQMNAPNLQRSLLSLWHLLSHALRLSLACSCSHLLLKVG